MTNNNNNNLRYVAHNRCDKQLRQYPLKYPLPKFTTRLPFKRNPLDLTIDSETLADWSYRQFPTSQISAKNYRNVVMVSKILMAFYYPTITSEDSYYHLLQDLIFIFIMDDNTEESWGQHNGQQMDKCREVWTQHISMFAVANGHQSNPNTLPVDQMEPFIRAIIPTFEAYSRQMSAEQWKRFVGARLEFAAANIEETELLRKNGGRFTSLEEKLRIHRRTIGLKPTLLSITYGLDIDLPERDWSDPCMKQLVSLVVDYCIYVNDIFSFEKELITSIKTILKTTTTTTTTNVNVGDTNITYGIGTGITIQSLTNNDNHTEWEALKQLSNIVAMIAIERKCSIPMAQMIVGKHIEQLDKQIIQLVYDWTAGPHDYNNNNNNGDCTVDDERDGSCGSGDDGCGGDGQRLSSLSPGGIEFVRALLYMPGAIFRSSGACDRYMIICKWWGRGGGGGLG
ncbi:uncharacterized protein LOC128954919 [Oppia nitens]|uniref:uncharacterized protein LOC128954919 n=1 Tax=Oppia nitens TaxID=1686743 RepID=UPI0023DA41BE|nr:uncharacterized protein LOC128954919 [Oppia nitens]